MVVGFEDPSRFGPRPRRAADQVCAPLLRRLRCAQLRDRESRADGGRPVDECRPGTAHGVLARRHHTPDRRRHRHLRSPPCAPPTAGGHGRVPGDRRRGRVRDEGELRDVVLRVHPRAQSEFHGFLCGPERVLEHREGVGHRSAPDRVRRRARDDRPHCVRLRLHGSREDRFGAMVESRDHRNGRADGSVALGDPCARRRRHRAASSTPAYHSPIHAEVVTHVHRVDAPRVSGTHRHDLQPLRELPERSELHVADRRLQAGRQVHRGAARVRARIRHLPPEGLLLPRQPIHPVDHRDGLRGSRVHGCHADHRYRPRLSSPTLGAHGRTPAHRASPVRLAPRRGARVRDVRLPQLPDGQWHALRADGRGGRRVAHPPSRVVRGGTAYPEQTAPHSTAFIP